MEKWRREKDFKKPEPRLFHCLRIVASTSSANFSSVAYFGVAEGFYEHTIWKKFPKKTKMN